MPGTAIDVRDVMTVAGHRAPPQRYYMTDVTLQEHVSVALLLQAFAPGTRIIRTEDVIPQGVTIPQFDDIMRREMDESQTIAAVVAERAAHLPVGVPRSHVSIVRFEPASAARHVLLAGDILQTVNGKPVHTTVNVLNALFKVRPGDRVRVTYRRGHTVRQATVSTIAFKGKTRLGVYLLPSFEPPRLAVPVRFKPFNVSGSSGGLMFAMGIYQTLMPGVRLKAAKIAGTGTIDYEGVIGAIEGAPQKLIAARRAGAQVFFVPRENYSDVANVRDIRVIPVHTFAEALRALSS